MKGAIISVNEILELINEGNMGKAIDYHPKVAPDCGYIVPAACPKCLDKKTKLGIK